MVFYYTRELGESVEDIITYLEGTIQCIRPEQFTQEELATIDEHIAECTSCGWWYSRCELSGSESGEVCESCEEEERAWEEEQDEE